MDEKKVAILISTYNGEKYIEEQLNSILNQSYKNIEIYVRDDGSKDNTTNILKKYEAEGKIKLKLGDNIGFSKSFLELLSYPEDASYYAFCDQDDVWMKEKIERAVLNIEKKDQKKPILYASNYLCYNSKMEYLRDSGYKKNKKTAFYKSIIECIAPGMTMCINDVAKEILIKYYPKNIFFHDWWVCLICSGLGEVIYDSKPSVKYRIHDSNVTVSKQGLIKDLKVKISRYLGNEFYKKIKKQCMDFYKIYGDKLQERDRKVLELYRNKKYSLKNQIIKTFYPKRYKDNLKDEIFIRCMFVLGKL